MEHNIIMAGFGGQGILLIGNLLAEAALVEGRQVTFMPSYGVEMRGGTANCTVVIADSPIGSPVLALTEAMIIMSAQALQKFKSRLAPSGFMILNTSLVSENDVQRDDIQVLGFPLNNLAMDLGGARYANMIALGAYLAKTSAVELNSLEEGFGHLLSEKNKKFIPKNIEAIQFGMGLVNGGA